eukprot:TRINITY_DN31543_c0_g1_i1.p1 TRINITY_DN31543_c0_g1~~TRINITY_DN31543_c0_g1_i1.p1  ORF type:complete len:142 (+),score=6.30 TRINITY_DN31543_c0_g1_i1:295-720(+)
MRQASLSDCAAGHPAQQPDALCSTATITTSASHGPWRHKTLTLNFSSEPCKTPQLAATTAATASLHSVTARAVEVEDLDVERSDAPRSPPRPRRRAPCAAACIVLQLAATIAATSSLHFSPAYAADVEVSKMSSRTPCTLR